MATTTHRRRRRHPKPPSPSEVALDDQLEAGVDELIGYLLAHCERWAPNEPPEVLDRLRRSPKDLTPPVGTRTRPGASEA